VGSDVKIEQAVAIVVDPDRSVAIDPAMQASRFGHVLEVVAVDVLEQREIPVTVDEDVLAAVVVEVAPHAAHRDAVAGAVEVRKPRARRNLLEGAVATVSIQCIRLAELAAGEVEIGPTVAVEVRYADRRTECRNVRLDVGDLGVERRTMMDEMDAGGGCFVTEREAGMGDVGRRTRLGGVHPNRRDDRSEDRYRDEESSQPLVTRR